MAHLSAHTALLCHCQTCSSGRQLLCYCLREAYAAFDKLLLESSAKAAGTVVSCPACGDYSEYQPDANDADGFPLQPVQLFCCIKCLQVTAAAAAAAANSGCRGSVELISWLLLLLLLERRIDFVSV